MPHARPSDFHITAIGHSTFLLQVGGANILTDPMFGERASPLRWAGPRRRHAPGLALDALPPIDLVLQSHDHYDHLDLDAARLLALRHPGAVWCAPLGVAARLASVGVPRIVERDWWGTTRVGDAEVTCVPAAHFSGRSPFDRDATLWCGWSVTIGLHRFYFIGDTGLHPAFADIAARLGGWDAILMPVGPYAPRWFMRPADPTVMIAMHWGTFRMSDEPLDEPAHRVRQGWAARGWRADDLWVLDPGETRTLRSAR